MANNKNNWTISELDYVETNRYLMTCKEMSSKINRTPTAIQACLWKNYKYKYEQKIKEIQKEESIKKLTETIIFNLKTHEGKDHLKIIQHVQKIDPSFNVEDFNKLLKGYKI